MNLHRVLVIEKLKALAEKLSCCEKVRQHDSLSEPQGWTLAYTFSELEQSFRKFLDDLIPRLLAEERSEERILDLLYEIGEEFRHILYHIGDSQFFSYLRSEFAEAEDEERDLPPDELQARTRDSRDKVPSMRRVRADGTEKTQPNVPQTSVSERVSSEDLAALVINALLNAGIVKGEDVELAMKIVTEGIKIRKILGDY